MKAVADEITRGAVAPENVKNVKPADRGEYVAGRVGNLVRAAEEAQRHVPLPNQSEMRYYL